MTDMSRGSPCRSPWLARLGLAGLLATLLCALLFGASPVAFAQSGGCARYTDPDKRARCQANEQRAAKTAERKRIDAERRGERRCAKFTDEKARADCEKKEGNKPR